MDCPKCGAKDWKTVTEINDEVQEALAKYVKDLRDMTIIGYPLEMLDAKTLRLLVVFLNKFGPDYKRLETKPEPLII